MSVVFNLYWTLDGVLHEAQLRFNGVSEWRFSAAACFLSDVVELVSLERRGHDGWEVFGELSNYAFSLRCLTIEEERLTSSQGAV